MEMEFEKQDRLYTEQLGEIPAEYLECRANGQHPFRPAMLDTGGIFPIRGYICVCCGMYKEKYRNHKGRMVSRAWHPKGDYFFTGTGRLTRERRIEAEQMWMEDNVHILPSQWPELAE